MPLTWGQAHRNPPYSFLNCVYLSNAPSSLYSYNFLSFKGSF